MEKISANWRDSAGSGGGFSNGGGSGREGNGSGGNDWSGINSEIENILSFD